MILPVVHYGHPVLRQKGARIESVTPEIKTLIADMFETMRENHGVGLAAQQVGRALQLTVMDVTGIEDRPSTLEVDGKPADPLSLMPLVLINPVLTPAAPPVSGAEGCLSFPEIFGDVPRPESVDVQALDGEGRPLRFRAGGLLARAIQHETDHLNGLLFIDRMDSKEKAKHLDDIETLHAATKRALARKRP